MMCACVASQKFNNVSGGAEPLILQNSKGYSYSLDANGKYFAATNSKGAELLSNLQIQSKSAMDAYKLNAADIKNGEYMYRNHTKGSYIHTWPEEYYDSPSFCYAYIKYKSMQRYPEIYNLIERALNSTHPSVVELKKKTAVKVLLMGGGPGFGAVAARDILEPRTVSVLNIDRSDMLGVASQHYESAFKNVDFNNDAEVLDVSKDVDIIIASFVIRYIKPSLLCKIISKNPKCIILVNHGTPNDKELMINLRRHVNIFNLMGKSTTQFMIASASKKITIGKPNLVFPGVPYR
jgi:ribosomal protein RSM22 (predicted rRNA methylase)